MKVAVIILGALLVLAVVGIGGFYLEENWRGGSAWSSEQKQIADAGEPASVKDLLPPDVPDTQNFGALALFQLQADPDDDGALKCLALKQALDRAAPGANAPPMTGSWVTGEATRFGLVEIFFDEQFRTVFHTIPNGVDLIDEIDRLFPPLKDLRSASAERPQVRFDFGYTTQPPDARPKEPGPDFIKLSRLIELHAATALRNAHPDVALDDLNIGLKIDDGLRHAPALTGGLVAISFLGVQIQAVWDGLHQHLWTDAQLADLQEAYSHADFLADYQLCLRGEALNHFAAELDYLRDHRGESARVATTYGSVHPRMAEIHGWLSPGGWYDAAKAGGVALLYRGAREPIDAATRRVYPDKSEQLLHELAALPASSLGGMILHATAEPALSAALPFAEAQFRADGTTIACALERYRLAHNAYPASLDALGDLAPRGLPHDPMTGQPYVYRALPDGTYLLYSVGWNQADDGGHLGYNSDSTGLNPRTGDWVWSCPDTATTATASH